MRSRGAPSGAFVRHGPSHLSLFDSTCLIVGIIIGVGIYQFTFGGWNEMAYLAAEVRNPPSNMRRAPVRGTVAVTVLYLLVNRAFLYAPDCSGMATSQAVATDTVSMLFPNFGGRMISALIHISPLGAVNGLVFT